MNADDAQKLEILIHRKERAVNIILYCIILVLLATDGLAGWLYHRY